MAVVLEVQLQGGAVATVQGVACIQGSGKSPSEGRGSGVSAHDRQPGIWEGREVRDSKGLGS